MRKKIPIKKLINKKYGRLTIIREAEPHIYSNGAKYRKVLCKCECGNYKEVLLSSLKNGHTQSCGCLQKELTKKRMSKHNLCEHPLYSMWKHMKQRCYNPNESNYKSYGARGITICDKWINDPETFIKWGLRSGWKKELYIDRENNNGNYTPDNCRFVDAGLSARNRRLLNSKNTSGYRGVHWNKQKRKWITQINHKHLGCFASPRLAALRYDAEAFLLNDGRPLNFTSGD